MRVSIVLGVLLYGAPLLAQGAARTVSPGMTKAQVIAQLGEPATSRTVGEDSYLFYLNKCGKQCGMNDLVILHADSVSDAIFRSPDRHYSGKSSSPTAIPPRVAAHSKSTPAGPMKIEPDKKPAEPAKTRPDSSRKAPKRMTPAPANDIRPSIPVNPPVLRSGPSPKPATKSKTP